MDYVLHEDAPTPLADRVGFFLFSLIYVGKQRNQKRSKKYYVTK